MPPPGSSKSLSGAGAAARVLGVCEPPPRRGVGKQVQQALKLVGLAEPATCLHQGKCKEQGGLQ